MTTAKTTYFQDATLNVLRNTTFTKVVCYLSLHTASPGESGSLTNEVSGGSYARENCQFLSPTNGVLRNTSSAIEFTTATASWGTITHVGINDAVSAGNMLYYGALDASKVVDTDDQITFPVNGLQVTET